MRITIKNVGCIKEADVKLDGLNVIAGPNGTGKSTVGKTVYTIIKSVSDSGKIVYEHRKVLVESMCRALFYSIQKNFQQLDSQQKNHDLNLLMARFNAGFARRLVEMLKSNDYSSVKESLVFQIKLIDEFVTLDEKSKTAAKKSLNDLMGGLTCMSEQEEIKDSLEFMYKKMFELQVNNLGTHATSEITLDDNGDKLLEYKVSNNANVLQFSDRLSITEINENLRQRILPEVTFIETPLVLQIGEKKEEKPYNLVSNNDKAWPYHWEDLLNKLKNDSGKTRSELCNYVYKDLSDLLKGELIYDTDKSDFFFVPTNTDNKLYVNNMASGEKMFGVLQKMARNGMLSPEHMLVLDEPENHLHPAWQIKLAELLVTLLEKDVSILLTTHSSVFISALQDFAYSKKLESKVNFYFAENGTIKDVEDFPEKEDVIFKSFYDARESLPDID